MESKVVIKDSITGYFWCAEYGEFVKWGKNVTLFEPFDPISYNCLCIETEKACIQSPCEQVPVFFKPE